MNLRDIRRKSGYTQEKLAKKLNIVRSTISAWENGISQPDNETLLQLAKIFNISVDEILGQGPVSYDQLTESEKEIVALSRKMKPTQIRETKNFMKYLLSNNNE